MLLALAHELHELLHAALVEEGFRLLEAAVLVHPAPGGSDWFGSEFNYVLFCSVLFDPVQVGTVKPQ